MESSLEDVRSIDLVIWIINKSTYPESATQQNISIAEQQVASKLMSFPNAAVIALKKVPGLSETEQQAYDNFARTIAKTTLVLYIDEIIQTRFLLTNEGTMEASKKNVALQAAS